MNEEYIDWKSRALAAEAKTLNLKNLCAHHGICTACGEYYSHHYIEPFATCNCNTSEWHELTGYMKLQDELRKLREQKPIWSGWSVWFKGGDGLFPAHFLHDSYGIPLRYPTRFNAVEKIKRHTKDSRELYEPREYSLYDAPVPVPHKGATHCDDCGLTWLDDGLNPLWCPYCKDSAPTPAAHQTELVAAITAYLKADDEMHQATRRTGFGGIGKPVASEAEQRHFADIRHAARGNLEALLQSAEGRSSQSQNEVQNDNSKNQVIAR